MRTAACLHTQPIRTTATLLLLLLAGALGVASTAHAQGGRSSDNILYPQLELPIYIGPDFGYGLWMNKASFGIADGSLPCAAFSDGDGSGFNGGVRAMIYLNRWLIISPRIRFEGRSGSFITPLPEEPMRNTENQVVSLQQEAQVDATISTITLDLRVAVDIARTGLYVAVGGAGSLLQNGSYDYTERLNGPGNMIYSDTKTNEHMLVDDGTFAQYEKTAFDLRGGLGYLFELGPVMINPEVFYSLPLTSAFTAPDELKQSGIVGTLGILYNIGE